MTAETRNAPDDENEGDEDRLYAIGELAREFHVSQRAIRFYETKGLLNPGRAGANRVYRKDDRARLILILRGKRLGFTLEEIAEYLTLYEAGPDQVTQIRLLLDKVERSIGALEQKRADVERTLAELRDIRNQCISGLKARS